jgi:hypothetical protein
MGALNQLPARRAFWRACPPISMAEAKRPKICFKIYQFIMIFQRREVSYISQKLIKKMNNREWRSMSS